jgi:hypothetical protein
MDAMARASSTDSSNDVLALIRAQEIVAMDAERTVVA